jgi:hypothetical protein
MFDAILPEFQTLITTVGTGLGFVFLATVLGDVVKLVYEAIKHIK